MRQDIPNIPLGNWLPLPKLLHPLSSPSDIPEFSEAIGGGRCGGKLPRSLRNKNHKSAEPNVEDGRKKMNTQDVHQKRFQGRDLDLNYVALFPKSEQLSERKRLQKLSAVKFCFKVCMIREVYYPLPAPGGNKDREKEKKTLDCGEETRSQQGKSSDTEQVCVCAFKCAGRHAAMRKREWAGMLHSCPFILPFA